MLFESLLNKLSQGVLLVNKEQRIVVWNDWLEKVSGLKKTDGYWQKGG
jgi:D-hexose-6-phosphate mutarotase